MEKGLKAATKINLCCMNLFLIFRQTLIKDNVFVDNGSDLIRLSIIIICQRYQSLPPFFCFCGKWWWKPSPSKSRLSTKRLLFMSVLLHFFFLSPKTPNQNNFSSLMTEEPMSFFSTRHSLNKRSIFKFLNLLGFSNWNKK